MLFEEDLTFLIREACYAVHSHLGSGLLESIYEKALIYELQERGFKVRSQVPIEVLYKGKNLGEGFRLDIVVEDTVVIELKSVEKLLPVHHKQLLSYPKLSSYPIGFLINFNAKSLDGENFKRYVNQEPKL